MEAKLHAANETLEETEKQISTVTAQKDAEIYRLSEEVRRTTPKVNTFLLFLSFFLLSQFLFPPVCVFFLPFFFPTYYMLCVGPSLLILCDLHFFS